MRRRVLVTDGNERAALAVVRSLHAAGHHVQVASPDGRSLAGASRGAARDHAVPDPLASPADFAQRIAEICAAEPLDTVIPISEAATLALLDPERRPMGVLIPAPTLETFRSVCDKPAILEAAAASGIAVPRQVRLDQPVDRGQIRPCDVTFPVVVKPARSVIEADGVRSKSSVRHASDWLQLQVALGEMPASAYPVLVQERIEGPGTGVFLLIWNGRVRAVFAHRRLREKPPSGGVSVCRESIAPDPRVVSAAASLLRRMGWQGVAMVEMKVSAATGIPYLMEVNGRFWGSLQLAVDAGVDFPALLLAAACGEPPAAPPPWRPGVRSRWEWGEVDHLIALMGRRRRTLHLPADAPGRLRTLGQILLWRRGDRPEVFRWSDPRPALRESLHWAMRR